jgi:hypothetical protein
LKTYRFENSTYSANLEKKKIGSSSFPMDKMILIQDLIGFYEEIIGISTQNNEEPKI